MQSISLDEIIANIEQGICFEASHEGDFYVKIQEYVPFICAAIHDGHRLRASLEGQCLLDEDERFYEEDPFTAEFIQSLPITLVGGDSRYEYDLNRNEDECIYDVAWGKKVWKDELSAEEREISLQKHRNFYRVVHALVSRIEKQFGACVLYDIHSYNYKRHETSFLFNIGIENIDIKKFNTQISHWKKELMAIKTRKVMPGVSVNHIFHGRGQLLKYISEHFDNTLVLATEVKKVFMDELTGQKYPMEIQALAKGLKTAILNNSKWFVNTWANFNVRRKGALLHGDIQPEVLNLDKKLFRMARSFELLGYVNPLNLESEKRKFFRSKFNENPFFRYKPLTIDPHSFKAKMYRLDVDHIEDIHIRQIYVDIIRSYADKVDMLAGLGTEQFFYNSLRYFGEPSDKDIADANFLLYCKELPQFSEEEPLSAAEVKKAFAAEGERYGFSYKVEVTSNISSDVLVMNSKQLVVLKKGAVFTPSRLNALLNHEIGVHMVTTMNAVEQPLKFLRLGLPRNTYSQEGLAILAEMNSGGLTVSRLRTLGMRVLAVKSMAQGNDFKTTFQNLLATCDVRPEQLFYIVARVYRGGGFTKDFLYLRGFRRMLQLQAKGTKLDNLFLGKTTHGYLPILNELVDRGILLKPKFRPLNFDKPVEVDAILKYLTNGIT